MYTSGLRIASNIIAEVWQASLAHSASWPKKGKTVGVANFFQGKLASSRLAHFYFVVDFAFLMFSLTLQKRKFARSRQGGQESQRPPE